MPKTVDINKTVEEIASLKKQITEREDMLKIKKKIMSDFFKQSGERSVSNSEITVYVQEKTNIEYDIPKIYEKLGNERADEFVEKVYSVNNIKEFIKFLKSKGLSNKDLKQYITVERKVNSKALDSLYEANEITVKDLEGCFTAEITKSVALRLKKDEKS